VVKKIDVDIDTWRTGERGTQLITDAVDACIAVALSNPRIGRGRLGHFSPDGVPRLNQMIQVARDEAATPGEVLLWFGGAATIPPRAKDAAEANREMMQFRARVARILGATQFALQRPPFWLPVGQWLSVALTSGSTRCSFKTEPGRY
jgi:hypothetical protein